MVAGAGKSFLSGEIDAVSEALSQGDHERAATGDGGREAVPLAVSERPLVAQRDGASGGTTRWRLSYTRVS
jgi:hypothetical protein